MGFNIQRAMSRLVDSSASPEAFVDFGGFFFEERAFDLDGFLPSGEDFAAG